MKAKHKAFGRSGGLSAWSLVVAVAFPAAGLAAPAARVEFAIGDVQVVARGGQQRAAQKGTEIDSGETISTNRGRAQLRFTDGAYVSLQPQSDFRIDDYRYEGRADGSERGFFSLLKGGLRTITGVVGRTNKANYQVSTAVATIGIRGTEYTIAYTNSITGSVGVGELEVCAAKCVPFGSGESFIVPSADSTPQLTTKKADLPPTQPKETPAFVAGDQVTGTGGPAGLFMAGTQTLDGVYFVNVTPTEFESSPVVFDSNGVVTDLAGTLPAGPVVQTGNDGIVAWGYFPKQVSVTTETLAFVTGLPTTNFSELLTGKKVATYALISPATPLLHPTTGDSIGTLEFATMIVSFQDFSATAKMGWTIPGNSQPNYEATLSGGFSAGPIFLGGSCDVGNCTVDARARVFGPNAIRAGIAYQFNDASTNTNGVGSAALVQTSLTP